MDQGERANFERLVLICHLQHDLSISVSNEDIRRHRRFDLFTSLANCCNSSSAQSDTELPYCLQQHGTYHATPFHLEGRMLNS
jgi:hypothetical protein